MSKQVEKLPKISVVTVSYNQCQFIEENIQSVIKQNYPNIEHIIIDAGSTDGTVDILKKYDGFEHIHWVSEPDRGQSHGLNKGFKKATGEIIGWFNSDDRVPPGALINVVNYFMEHPGEIAVVGDQNLINQNGDKIRTIKSREYTFDYLVHHAKGITQNSTFFRRSVFNEIGFINEEIHFAMDRDFFIRLTRERAIPYISECLGEFRIQENSKTNMGSFYFSKELIKIRKKYGANLLSPGLLNDYYVVITEPLRRIEWLRSMVQQIRRF